MEIKPYSHRVWLDKGLTPSSRAVMVYHGPVQYKPDEEPDVSTFIKLSSCHDEVHIHRTYEESMEEYIEKLLELKSVLEQFIWHLEEEVK